jgi:putative transposase
MAVAVGSAYSGDRDGLRVLLYRFRDVFLKLKLLWTEKGYNGENMRDDLLELGIRQDVIGGIRPKGQGFKVEPRRWVVERTFGWLGRFRRLSKDYEFYPSTSESMIYLSMSRLMLRRIARIC